MLVLPVLLPALTVTELVLAPLQMPFTSRLIEQFPPPFSAPFERLTVEEPAVAVTFPPPQSPNWLFGVATTSPTGRLSVKLIPDSANTLFGLWMSNESDVVPN